MINSETPYLDFDIDNDNHIETVDSKIEQVYQIETDPESDTENERAVCTLETETSQIVIDDFHSTNCEWYIKNYNDAYNPMIPPSNYRLDGDTLLYRYSHKLRPFEREWKFCVPDNHREEVCYANHDDQYHGGFYKTYRRIYEVYYWPRMYDFIYKYVKNCETCRVTKASNEQTNTPLTYDRTENLKNFEALSIDFIGRLPLSSQRNQWLLVIMCVRSKFVWLKPMRKADANACIKFIRDEIFYRYSVCRILISDNGSQFRSKAFQDFFSSFGVQIHFTPVYDPRSNPTEAVNKTIGSAIRAYITTQSDHKKWDKELARIACSLNTAIHTSTQISPYKALYGCEMVSHATEYRYLENEVEVDDRRVMMDHHIREHLRKAFEKRARQHNLRARVRDFHVGDEVYLPNNKLSKAGENYAAKFAPKKIKAVIIKKIGNNTYELCSAHNRGKHLGKWHARDIFTR